MMARRFFLLAAIFATTTAVESENENTAKTRILALEKGSNLSIKIETKLEAERKAVESNRTPNEKEGSSADKYKYEDADETDDPSFPGIFTAHYTYHTSTANAYANRNTGSWLEESDVIRIECDDSDADSYINAGSVSVSGVRSCEGHLLVRSEDEYRDISGQKSLLCLSLSNPNPNPCLLSLEYNLDLTKQWIHPRMEVAKEHNTESAAKARRGRYLRQDDIDNNIDNEIQRKTMPRFNFNDETYSTIPSYDCYYNYQGTMKWIQDFIARTTDSSLLEVTWTDIGDSWEKTQDFREGYDIHALTITGKPQTGSGRATTTSGSFDNLFERSDATENKAPFLIVSAVHAREYTPPILVRLWLEHFIEKIESGDPTSLSMMEHTKIHWIPYLNPDGRILAETTQPNRRKNVNDELGSCGNKNRDSVGIDLNRNLGFEWGKSIGSSNNPCSQSTRGKSPESEPETKVLVNYAKSVFPPEQRNSNALATSGKDYSIAHTPGVSVEQSSRIWRGYDPLITRGVFVDVHSFGKVYVYPWGNIDTISPNDLQFRSTMGHIQSLTGNEAKGPGNFFSPASGATDDWAYGVLGALSMTWELGSSFREPCAAFENDYEKHFGAFAHLASIAPFPFALGTGPIVVSIDPLPTITLYYLPTTLGNREIVRMGTDSVLDLGESLEIVIAAQLPDVISTKAEPIKFYSGNSDDSSWASETDEPSSISNVRIFFRNGNPLAGAKSANSASTDRIGDYWDLNANQISLTKTQLWEAFGASDESDDEDSTEHMLYFQAVDDVGNWGPVSATRLSVVIRKDDVEEPPSCEDSTTFRFKGSRRKTCAKWVGDGKRRNIKKKCMKKVRRRKRVYDFCPATCGRVGLGDCG